MLQDRSNLTLNFAKLPDGGRDLNHLLRFLTKKFLLFLRQLCLAYLIKKKKKEKRREGYKFGTILKVDNNADKQSETVECKEKWKLFLL